MPKLIRITTVPMALRYLLPGQMLFMKENGFDVLMISANGKERDEVIRKEQCRHIIVPFTRRITPVRDILCLFRLIAIFRKEKPDIVHSHTPKAGLLGMVAAKLCNVKTRIHTVAGLPMMVEKGFRFRLLKCTEKITYASALQVWPNSPSLMDYIRTHRLADPIKLRLIAKGSSNGIDTDGYNPGNLDADRLRRIKESMRHSAANKYLLFAGRIVADKGIPELVRVFLKLRKEDERLRLILLGGFEPSLDPLPEDVVMVVENDPCIIHVQWTDEVKYYMNICDLFIFPSRREGFPNVLLQAGAMELPVICSRIAGNVDIISNHQTGLVFENGNETEMYALVKYALDNPGEMRFMAKKLKGEVEENYRRENIWKNILQAYKSLLNWENN